MRRFFVRHRKWIYAVFFSSNDTVLDQILRFNRNLIFAELKPHTIRKLMLLIIFQTLFQKVFLVLVFCGHRIYTGFFSSNDSSILQFDRNLILTTQQNGSIWRIKVSHNSKTNASNWIPETRTGNQRLFPFLKFTVSIIALCDLTKKNHARKLTFGARANMHSFSRQITTDQLNLANQEFRISQNPLIGFLKRQDFLIRHALV